MIECSIPGICGEGMYFSYSSSALVVAAIILVIGIFFGIKSLKSRSEIAAAIGIFLATIGIYGAEDLFTNYICFEAAGFLSVFWILHGTEKQNNERIKRYLGWQVITGMIMTMGMFLISHNAGTLVYEELAQIDFFDVNRFGFWYDAVMACYIIGYGSRSALCLLHSWIDSVYNENTLQKGLLFSIVILPGGLWSLKQLFLSMFSPLESWNNELDSWEAMEQLVMVVGGLTILLGIYRIWCSREKGQLFGNVSMIASGVLYIFAMLLSESNLVFIGYFCVILAAYFIIRKINWKPLHSLDLDWFSAERMLYEPLFIHALPFAFGVIFRILDYLSDWIVATLRGTIYQDSKQRVWDKIGTPTTYIFGIILDEITLILNKTVLRKKPIHRSFVNAAAVLKKEWDTTTQIIMGSVSFGLMLFSVGMIIVVIYIMI